jgi:hypothetical protein
MRSSAVRTVSVVAAVTAARSSAAEDAQAELGDPGRVHLLLEHLRHADQRDAVVQRFHRRAHARVRDERAGVAQHRGLREPRPDVDVVGHWPQVVDVNLPPHGDGDRTGVVERLQARPVEVRPVVERGAQRDVEHRFVRR